MYHAYWLEKAQDDVAAPWVEKSKALTAEEAGTLTQAFSHLDEAFFRAAKEVLGLRDGTYVSSLAVYRRDGFRVPGKSKGASAT